MAHFARLDENNKVTQVCVVSNQDLLDEYGFESESLGIAVCEQTVGPGPWVQTSFNNSFRKQYAGVGCFYDATNDVFISPSPYPSWVLNADFDWVAPIEKPNDGKAYLWNELQGTWVVEETA